MAVHGLKAHHRMPIRNSTSSLQDLGSITTFQNTAEEKKSNELRNKIVLLLKGIK